MRKTFAILILLAVVAMMSALAFATATTQPVELTITKGGTYAGTYAGVNIAGTDGKPIILSRMTLTGNGTLINQTTTQPTK